MAKFAKKVAEVSEVKVARVKAPQAKSMLKAYILDENDADNYPLTETPADYDFSIHKLFKRKNYANEAAWRTYQAEFHEYMASVRRQEAADAKSGKGSAAKKLQKMQEKMAELRAQLEADGIDVDALLNS